jgi:hypothetical protein
LASFSLGNVGLEPPFDGGPDCRNAANRAKPVADAAADDDASRDVELCGRRSSKKLSSSLETGYD